MKRYKEIFSLLEVHMAQARGLSLWATSKMADLSNKLRAEEQSNGGICWFSTSVNELNIRKWPEGDKWLRVKVELEEDSDE